MKDKSKFLEKRVSQKEDELVNRQKSFELYWKNYKNNGNFEDNAIKYLLIIKQLKDEINELKFILSLK